LYLIIRQVKGLASGTTRFRSNADFTPSVVGHLTRDPKIVYFAFFSNMIPTYPTLLLLTLTHGVDFIFLTSFYKRREQLLRPTGTHEESTEPQSVPNRWFSGQNTFWRCTIPGVCAPSLL
jgi:hypothetical protein